MDGDLQLPTVGAMSFREVNGEAIFTARKGLVGHSYVVIVFFPTGTDTKQPIRAMTARRITKNIGPS